MTKRLDVPTSHETQELCRQFFQKSLHNGDLPSCQRITVYTVKGFIPLKIKIKKRKRLGYIGAYAYAIHYTTSTYYLPCTSLIGTNCTISLVAIRPVELSSLRPLSASSTCQAILFIFHIMISTDKSLITNLVTEILYLFQFDY